MPSRTLYVKPYVFGAVLNPEQLCALAEQKCGAEKIARHCGYHATALNNVYHEQGIQECFLHYAKPGSDESLYLWVQGVLPSFNRTKPIFDIPCLDDSHPEMKSIGYVGLDCFAWPRTISRTSGTHSLSLG